MRFLTPILFFLAGVWVWWSNDAHSDRVVTLPFLDLFVEDIHQQGRVTAYICWGLAAWFVTWDLLALLRRRPDRMDV